MSRNLKLVSLGIAVAALAATATYWRSRALRLEEALVAKPGVESGAAGRRRASAPAVAAPAKGNLPARIAGRRGHAKKPPWKKVLAAKLRREEKVQHATDEDLERAWEALVSKAVEGEIKRRFSKESVAEADRQRLMEQLRRVREVNEVKTRAGDANADVRARMVRTVALLQADRIFRDVLGIGVSDFIAGLSGKSQIQEVSTPKVAGDSR